MTKLATLDATLDKFYPIGSVYMTIVEDFNPNVTFGGTWQLLPSGKSLQTTDSGGATD